MSKKSTATPKRQVRTTWAYQEFVKQVRAIADHRNMNTSEVLDKYAAPAIAREYKRVIEEMQRDLDQ